ncbi:hypothetical protein ACOW85_003902, partial [Vibrio parahaemolyticus]
ARVLNEPPCAEPHAGWCGGWRLDTSGYPISCQTQGFNLEFITALPTLSLCVLKNSNQAQFQSACH